MSLSGSLTVQIASGSDGEAPLKMPRHRRRKRPADPPDGAAVRSRTSNLLIRSQMLYPIELRLHFRFGTGRKAHAAVRGNFFPRQKIFPHGFGAKSGAALRAAPRKSDCHKSGWSRAADAIHGMKMVRGAGFEPATPTVSSFKCLLLSTLHSVFGVPLGHAGPCKTAKCNTKM